MTTIAYRDRVMASDSRAYSGDSMPIGTKVKIRRLDDGSLVGVSSNVVGLADRIHEWIAGGMPKEHPTCKADQSFEVLLVKPEGQVFYANDEFMLTGPLDASYWAIGSGSKYALGAMHVGACAEAAVECGCAFDVWSSRPVYALDLKVPA